MTEAIAWRLVDRDGQRATWATTRYFDPGLTADSARTLADQNYPDRAPFRWQALGAIE